MLNIGNPPHPGEVLIEGFLGPLNIKQNEFAKLCNVSYRIINKFVNGGRKANFCLAVKLAKMLHTDVDFWIELQLLYDLSRNTRIRRAWLEVGYELSDYTPKYPLADLEHYCSIRCREFIENRNAKSLDNRVVRDDFCCQS